MGAKQITLQEECALRKKARSEGWLNELDLPRGKKKRKKREIFLRTIEWLEVRQIVLGYYGRKCQKCGSINKIQVDHVKPRSIYPELALDIMNLQILCWPCNKAKNTQTVDYRNIQNQWFN